MGRLSILLKSISLNEKQANALYNAPGLLGNVNTIEVLAGIFLLRNCDTPDLPNNKNLVKFDVSSSHAFSKQFISYVSPANSLAIAAVFCGVHLSGNARSAFVPILACSPFSLRSLADPAVSYMGTGVMPFPLK